MLREGGGMGRIEDVWQGDRLSRELGLKLEAAEEGYGRVSVGVEERFLNAHGIGHGVLLFALADAAFAVAANSVADAVGIQYSFNVFRAALPGETIFGEARMLHGGRRSLVCELKVTNESGRVLAQGQATALPVSRDSYQHLSRQAG